MENITTGIAYGSAAANGGYWALQWMDQISPNQWAAIGVLGSLLFGLLTFLSSLYFKHKEDRRKDRYWKGEANEAE
ncbi:class II holin family protein [Atlantibacter hermannii]|uniref:class II holin family protein n=1 Tax=Atlantibacter hermannii TaxID=565 RepID=UPI0035B6A0B1